MSLFKAFFLYSLFLSTMSFNKTCNTENKIRPCAEQILQCPDEEPKCSLFVTCLGYKSCENVLVDRRPAAGCTLDCRGDTACDSLHIICPPDSECNINCVSDEEKTCSDINITSNTNTVTNIQCRGNDACYAGTVHCADSDKCNLDCWGERACTGPPSVPFTIYGERTNTLNISDCIHGAAPCANMNVFCPFSADDTARCLLPGKGIFNERGAHNTVSSGGINVYAVHSWHDVLITGYDADNIMSGVMFCGPHNNASCEITNRKEQRTWDCVNDTHLCAASVYTEPSMEPTMEPTYIPTSNPTMNPTIDPTEVPTKEPTSDPTNDPTTEPTQSTTAPTRAPSTEPSRNPTVAPSVAVVKEEHFGGETEYGLLVGVILFVVFVCAMVYGWRCWSKGNEVAQTDHSLRMLGQQKRKRKNNRNGRRVQLDSDGSSSMDLPRAPVIEVVQNTRDMNGQKKTRKKKKKKKKKKQDGDNAGHYQKHTDDPFQNNQWTELTKFD
eukprot:236412_1